MCVCVCECLTCAGPSPSLLRGSSLAPSCAYGTERENGRRSGGQPGTPPSACPSSPPPPPLLFLPSACRLPSSSRARGRQTRPTPPTSLRSGVRKDQDPGCSPPPWRSRTLTPDWCCLSAHRQAPLPGHTEQAEPLSTTEPGAGRILHVHCTTTLSLYTFHARLNSSS